MAVSARRGPQHPVEQVFQHPRVLLDDEEERLAAGVDGEVVRYPAAEVAPFEAGRDRVGPQLWIDAAHPERDVLPAAAPALRGAVVAEKALVEPQLGLAAQVAVQPREHDDDGVAGIRRLADQARIARGLAGLHVADDEAAAFVHLIVRAESSRRRQGEAVKPRRYALAPR